jgi:hypothetical protein|tara:strand:- start:42 stop:308 length:267 start_codon:yes stop_codon:yes gene_type:complete
MKFDSSIQSPIKDAINIIQNHKISPHATRIKDIDFYKARMLIVLKEKICGNKTLKEVASILNLKTAERVRQLEHQVLRILNRKMKGYK